MSIWDLLEERVRATPSGLFAMDERGRELTFLDLHDRALSVAAGLSTLGVSEDSVVSWQLPNWLESAMLTLALDRLGATQNPLIPILRLREVDFICNQASTDLLVVPGVWRDFDYAEMASQVVHKAEKLQVLVADRVVPEADPRDVPPRPSSEGRWYFYTSGTTADPKGAIHCDATLIAGARSFHSAVGITASDRATMVIPFTHIGGIIHLISSLTTGSTMVFCEAFDPERTTLQLREQGATILPGGLPFVQAFFKFQERHPELDPLFPAARVMIHGGSPKPVPLHYEVKERLCASGVVSGYGMTECPMFSWNTPQDSDEDLATSEGRPGPGADAVVVNADGTRAGPGEDGELHVRGPQLMLGYVASELDAGAFDEEGYFCSGDIGRMDEHSRITITGRLKDVIIRNMENVSATEVENLLYLHPKVLEVAVIGVDDPVTGERVCAVVVPADPDDPPTLIELCDHLLASGLSKRKAPERLELVAKLPRNAMEKVLKTELRRQFN
jgi:acyl-CoA synthetase (AMP-forming)/AMP-acid ligase II